MGQMLDLNRKILRTVQHSPEAIFGWLWGTDWAVCYKHW